MAASAHLLLSALSPHTAEPPAGDPLPADGDFGSCPFSAESTCAETPLTSEPPLPDAAPLTSEPPLAEAAPLTSQSTPEAAERDLGRAES
ncbi:hypothetical protein STXM2123_5365 [Streptomyces sp. F-3]|uniref:Secreted protein n=1 Tax=Streptomyces thermogriseus TaxID=75292 RepID=A0ABN1T3F3_9ACTN|nr:MULTISPECIES: hypothetical protein [unclassified Streptomyces]MDN5384474.1 hypothetical protein [Streptomyces sp. LB8]GAT84664.1 hypothetical protein STXM2123_5365 [Streptomyces sp. F-3]